MKHPMQKLVIDDDRTVRFQKNAIVEFLLQAGPFDMNMLAMMPWDREDREQFAQLIGYSVCGFGELPYVSDDLYEYACNEAETILAEES